MHMSDSTLLFLLAKKWRRAYFYALYEYKIK